MRTISRKENIWYNIMQYGLEFIGKHYSSYRAFVIENNDPLKLNRLQLLIPHINEFKPDGTWAFPKGTWGGKDYGTQMLPQKGDMVWVEFEYGNADYPIWSHASYGEEEIPEEFSTVNHYGFKTPLGSIVLINDNEGEEEILVKLNSNKDWIKWNTDILELESKLIKLGEKGEEQAVMGNTLKKKLEQILEEIDKLNELLINHNHTSSSGPTGTPINANFIEEVKEELLEIKGTLPEILSDKVKIDK